MITTKTHGAKPGKATPKEKAAGGKTTTATRSICTIDSTGDDLVLTTTTTEARIDTRLLAGQLGNKHRHVIALLDKYHDLFKKHGHVTFKKAVGERKQGGGKAERVALLNEEQALFLLALSRNTDRVVELKFKLIQAFSAARRNAQQRKEEYLPSYHGYHDRIGEVSSGSKNAKHIHANFNRLVNRVVGIEAGQRSRAPVAALTIAQQVAVAALAGAVDHHDGYQRAKTALGMLESLIQGQPLGVAHHG